MEAMQTATILCLPYLPKSAAWLSEVTRTLKPHAENPKHEDTIVGDLSRSEH
jgi:hypothetical protein